ncbi:ABC transporter permease [Bacteroidota bacterium]
MSEIHPPKIARLIVKFFSRRDNNQSLLHSFDEEFYEIAEGTGKFQACIWYWVQIIKSIPRFIKSSIYWGVIMFKSYLITAIRNIKKNKGYSFINISGLAIGIACCLLITMFIQDELSYDTFHKNADHVFRAVTSAPPGELPTNANGTLGIGPGFTNEFSEITDFVRLRKMGNGAKRYVGYGDKKFYEEWFFFADSSFFKIFTFPLLKGDPATALKHPNSIVITEEMAKKYFGSEDPMGKIMETDPYNSGEMMLFTVTAIAKNVPPNSHFHFDFLVTYNNLREDLSNLSSFMQNYTYFLLKNPESVKSLEAEFLPYLKRNWREDPWYTVHLQPLLDIRLHSNLNSEIQPVGDINDIYIFSIIALLVLIIASINFMNLSTARSAIRAKEVGLRKVVGAGRKQIVYQFLGESIIISFIGGLVSIILILLLLPVFNQIADKQFTIQMLAVPSIINGIIGIVLFIGFVSGSYVAFVLSSFKPVNTLKGVLKTSGSGKFVRKGLVVFQFVLSIVIIFSTLTVNKQMLFIKEQNAGYKKNEIMVIPLNKDLRQNYDAIRNELINFSGIHNTTTSSYVPTRGSAHHGITFEGMNDYIIQVVYHIDKEFLDTYDIKLVAGRNITHSIFDEGVAEFLISTETLKEAGYSTPEEALGKRIEYQINNGSIQGVVNNINIYSLHERSMAIVYYVSPIENHQFLSIRLKGGTIPATIDYIKSVWNELVPNYPLDYFFLDESFEQLHRSDQRLSEVFKYFGLQAIVVACMGLLGMAAFAAEQRRKEIGIRRTLGAHTFVLYYLLSKDLLKWIVVAMLIAWPIGFYVMDNWLTNFVYKIEINVWLFINSGAFALLVAMLTISWQSIKAATTNPVESLRDE